MRKGPEMTVGVRRSLGIFFAAVLSVCVLATAWAAVDYKSVRVTKVFDGDTLRIAGGEKVRLIGIDTPERFESDKLFRDANRTGQDIRTIQAMGDRAHAFTERLVGKKKVRLEFDVERRDRYGRLLAYVYIFVCPPESDCPLEQSGDISYELVELEDGQYIFLNATILKSGYASLMNIPPNVRRTDEFQALYREARDGRRGLWKDGVPGK